MNSPTRSLLTIALATLAALLATETVSEAQTTIRSRLNDRNRDRQVPAAQPAPEAATPTAPTPPATVEKPAPATQPAKAATQPSLAQNSVESATSKLPASLMNDERTAGVANAVKSRVSDELEGKSTEDVIRAAQQRLSSLRSGSASPTITDLAAGATAAKKAATSEPAPAAPMTAQPVATPPQAQPQAAPIPEPTTAPVAASDAPRAAAPAPLASPGGVPAPVPLRPKYEKEKHANQAMEIQSDESLMDNTQRIVTFQGNVFVNHPEFKLASDHLEIHLNEDSNLDGSSPAPKSAAATTEDEDAPPFKRAIATGGMVEIEKIGADGKTQIAKARKADYDALTGDIVLSGGPPTLQSGTGFVNPKSPDALIILRGNGQHEVKGGAGGQNIFSIPIKRGAKTTTTPLGGDLESLKSGNR
jgi:lipopolysaccharide export system protein LptA